LKFSDGVGTLLKFIFSDRSLCRLVSRSMFSGVCVLLSCVWPRALDAKMFLELPLLLLLLKLSIGCEVLVLILLDLRTIECESEREGERGGEVQCT
jgi:hypothetical protein